MLRTDNSVFKRHDCILSGLFNTWQFMGVRGIRFMIYKRREAFTFAAQRLHYLSVEHTQVNTIVSAQSQTRRKPTRSHGRILLDSTATEQEDSSVSSNT